jgi:hypothetical protein
MGPQPAEIIPQILASFAASRALGIEGCCVLGFVQRVVEPLLLVVLQKAPKTLPRGARTTRGLLDQRRLRLLRCLLQRRTLNVAGR